MSKQAVRPWVEGELRLAGLDSRLIALLRAVDDSGSINQAAKQQGLSYKGAWQIIERANTSAPQVLISTSIGGTKGGGTRLTDAGKSLLALFDNLQQQHQDFIASLNQRLACETDAVLLLQRLAVKSSVRNQLFGRISAISLGAVSVEVTVTLKAGTPIVANISRVACDALQLQQDAEALLLIDSSDISLALDVDHWQFSARNCLACTVIQIEQDDVNAEIKVALAGGESLSVLITRHSAEALALLPGQQVWALCKRNAPILGVLE
jgi:molybdate transport system regulatory protein